MNNLCVENNHKRQKYFRADKRILKKLQEFLDRTKKESRIDEYLRRMAHNFLID